MARWTVMGGPGEDTLEGHGLSMGWSSWQDLWTHLGWATEVDSVGKRWIQWTVDYQHGRIVIIRRNNCNIKIVLF